MEIRAHRIERKRHAEPIQQWEHRQHVQQMLKIIHVSDLDVTTKMVMRANIWGLSPKQFRPITPYEIQLVDRGVKECPHCVYSRVVDDKGYAKITKCATCRTAERRIEAIIEKGKAALQELLRQKTAQECVDAFNREERKNRTDMFDLKRAKSTGLKLIE